MTDNTMNTGETDAGSASALVALGSPDEQADLPEDLTGLPDEEADLAEDLTEVHDDSADDAPMGSGALSGGFGFAGLALAIVSLTTNWTSSVVISHSQYNEEVHASASGLTPQQQLDMYASGWHTQGWWAFVFAIAALLFGAGALLLP